MAFWLECVVGVLAAVGLICIIKETCAILFGEQLRVGVHAELYIYGNGANPRTIELLRAVQQIQIRYLPEMTAIFIETNGQTDACSFAQALCERHNAEYIGE